MQMILKERLQAYIIENNPDLMLLLQVDFSVTRYLEDKVARVMPTVMRLLEEQRPGYIIQELALKEMTAELRPSRYNYLLELLEAEFEADYLRFEKAGVLTYELINMIAHCKGVFEDFKFSEAQLQDRFLRYAMLARMHDYLN